MPLIASINSCRNLVAVLLLLLGAPSALAAPAQGPAELFAHQRAMIERGVQAVLTCNGLFTSGRTLEQIFAQELRYLDGERFGTPTPELEIDRDRRAVAVGAEGPAPVMRAAFRKGIGCIVLAPHQDFGDIDKLPELQLPPPPGDPDRIPWPLGDLVEDRALDSAIDAEELQAASDWAFARPTPEQDTLSLLILHKEHIIHERYAPGVDRHTRTRTWSTAKSIAATLIGILADRGTLALDEPAGLDWLPEEADAPHSDPRHEITLRHLLNMSSGLYPVDSWGMEYATGSGLAYWAGAGSVRGALDRGLVRAPGTSWDYENYDTLLAVYAMKRALGDQQTYLEFPRRALLDRLGMRSTLLSTDRFGDFVLSSQVYTNARDLARFGLLYLQNGEWMGERVLSEEWIEFVRTPAPATAERGRFYGGQWWLVPEDRTDVPGDAYSTAGNRGQYVIVAPSHDLVIVRRGLDWGRQGFDRWDLLREVLKAFARRPASS